MVAVSARLPRLVAVAVLAGALCLALAVPGSAAPRPAPKALAGSWTGSISGYAQSLFVGSLSRGPGAGALLLGPESPCVGTLAYRGVRAGWYVFRVRVVADPTANCGDAVYRLRPSRGRVAVRISANGFSADTTLRRAPRRCNVNYIGQCLPYPPTFITCGSLRAPALIVGRNNLNLPVRGRLVCGPGAKLPPGVSPPS